MKALVAMSGGVDSSVAAALMLEAGHDVVGVTLKPAYIAFGPEASQDYMLMTRLEPAFLITKPYDPNAVKAAISQALFFRTTASLDA